MGSSIHKVLGYFLKTEDRNACDHGADPEVRIVQCNFSEISQGDQHSATKYIDDNNWE